MKDLLDAYYLLELVCGRSSFFTNQVNQPVGICWRLRSDMDKDLSAKFVFDI